MLLTIETTHRPATDLGFLLHKNPDRLHEKSLSFGRAVMCFPEADEDRCRFALTVEVDPIGLVRGRAPGASLHDHYVNDRPYAASSFLSVAIARALNTAFAGRSKHRQELAETPIPLAVTVLPLAARGSEDLAKRLFEPLGYEVETLAHALDPALPDWGASPYITLRLEGSLTLRELLTHLYVLVPVLDNSKHYYVDDDEVEKLVAKGAGWLEQHPERDFIVNRALKRRRRLVREALARLTEEDEADDADEPARQDEAEDALERPIRLNDLRMARVTEVLAASGARRVVDLGCGEGRLLRELLASRQFEEVVGVDTSLRSLERASQRLKLDRMPERQAARLKLLHGALTYRDRRLEGYDAAALVEVIEHIDQDRHPALERALFEFMAPPLVVVTTPNREYNALFENMPAGALRHGDHRFEWTRAEFESWAHGVAERFGYALHLEGIGEVHAELGAPTQMAIFERGRQ
ncbi:3' terminal RNA ribose 2'-O-methyltransferase Hen1 [Pelagibius marinus]|uniref:3' terminal RNA ribose 2'-O-methyltransferase Hen1 n=1 Tax=Pelagibius marinus TaxID=2762760 RepID=UPI0018722575|nr:3' terminal RNA ribose 2'-O-methyltransferase Hen1 [Pelagibius marinus]